MPLEARYANCINVGFNDVELVLDFGQQYEGGEPLYHTRIVTNPVYVPGFLDVLAGALAEYRAARGEDGGGNA